MGYDATNCTTNESCENINRWPFMFVLVAKLGEEGNLLWTTGRVRTVDRDGGDDDGGDYESIVQAKNQNSSSSSSNQQEKD
jgi:hypothetical protein